MNGWKRTFQAKEKEKCAGVSILTLDKIDFHVKSSKRDAKGHYGRITASIHQEEIRTINVYALNQRAPNYVKHLLADLKGNTDFNTRIDSQLQISRCIITVTSTLINVFVGGRSHDSCIFVSGLFQLTQLPSRSIHSAAMIEFHYSLWLRSILLKVSMWL